MYTPIHIAVMEGDVNQAKNLIKKRLDLNVINAITTSGFTPLHFAIIDSHEEVAKLLIDEGASLNIQNILGDTPLHYACRENLVSIVDLLVNTKKVDTTIKNRKGKTAYDIAYEKGFTHITQFFTAQ